MYLTTPWPASLNSLCGTTELNEKLCIIKLKLKEKILCGHIKHLFPEFLVAKKT